MSQAQHLITSVRNFDIDKLTFDEPVVNKRGGKQVNIRYDGHPWVQQYPLMLTWGGNEWADEQGGYTKYDHSLQFESGRSQTQVILLDILKQVEEKILDYGTENGKKWFGKKMSRPVLEALFYPMLKYRKDKETGEPDMSADPTWKHKIPCYDGRFQIEVYDMNRQPLYLPPKYGKGVEGNKAPGQSSDSTPIDFIPKAAHCKGLARCGGIWFAGGKFGVTWQELQTQVRPPARLVGSGTCFVADDDDDDFEEYLEKKEAEAEVEEEIAGIAEAAADEDEYDEEEEEEVVVAAPVKKKKKVVRRKKKATSAE